MTATAGAGGTSTSELDALDALQHAVAVAARAFRGLAPAKRRLIGQASDFEVLRTLAEGAAGVQNDVLARAHLRGLAARRALVEAAGGFLDGATVARLLGLTAAAVPQALPGGAAPRHQEEKRRIGYPALQFDEGRVVAGVPETLRELAAVELDAWAQLRFLGGSQSRLGGRTPIQALKGGALQEVLAAARAFGDHGAA